MRKYYRKTLVNQILFSNFAVFINLRTHIKQ